MQHFQANSTFPWTPSQSFLSVVPKLRSFDQALQRTKQESQELISFKRSLKIHDTPRVRKKSAAHSVKNCSLFHERLLWSDKSRRLRWAANPKPSPRREVADFFNFKTSASKVVRARWRQSKTKKIRRQRRGWGSVRALITHSPRLSLTARIFSAWLHSIPFGLPRVQLLCSRYQVRRGLSSAWNICLGYCQDRQMPLWAQFNAKIFSYQRTVTIGDFFHNHNFTSTAFQVVTDPTMRLAWRPQSSSARQHQVVNCRVKGAWPLELSCLERNHNSRAARLDSSRGLRRCCATIHRTARSRLACSSDFVALVWEFRLHFDFVALFSFFSSSFGEKLIRLTSFLSGFKMYM